MSAAESCREDTESSRNKSVVGGGRVVAGGGGGGLRAPAGLAAARWADAYSDGDDGGEEEDDDLEDYGHELRSEIEQLQAVLHDATAATAGQLYRVGPEAGDEEFEEEMDEDEDDDSQGGEEVAAEDVEAAVSASGIAKVVELEHSASLWFSPSSSALPEPAWLPPASLAPPELETVESHDTSAAAARALELNRQCQERLRRALQRIETSLAKNAQLQCALQSKETDGRDSAGRSVSYATGRWYFQTANGSMPAETEAGAQLRRLREKMPLVYKNQRWTDAERNSLHLGVVQQAQEQQVRALLDKYKGQTRTPAIQTELKQRMAELQSISPTATALDAALAQGIQWEKVAGMFVPGRSALECRLQWINVQNPSINKSASWTLEEDKRLQELAKEHSETNWAVIASTLGTNRTAAQCLRRYMRDRKESERRGEWTLEEDEQLKMAVSLHGTRNWLAISKCLPGRTGGMCAVRWKHTLGVENKGHWKPEEDAALKWAVMVIGPPQWQQISTYVPGRSDLQCRERWCNVLDPAIKRSNKMTASLQMLYASMEIATGRSLHSILRVAREHSAAGDGCKSNRSIFDRLPPGEPYQLYSSNSSSLNPWVCCLVSPSLLSALLFSNAPLRTQRSS
eukprot:jgi/Chlat1/1284/Chrsp117S08655